MTQIEYSQGAGSQTGMNYDFRDARNRSIS